MTKSRLPRIETTSLIMWPGRIFERMLRLTKEGERGPEDGQAGHHLKSPSVAMTLSLRKVIFTSEELV